jgi:class I fructose-bisphosphate aldolase
MALTMAAEVVRGGARGMTVGRNIWGVPEIAKAVRALKAVIHDRADPQEAQRQVGLRV